MLRLSFIAIFVVCICVIALTTATFVVVEVFSASGEDSWSHYMSGGVYPSGPPAAFSVDSHIYFSSPCSGNGDIYVLAERDETPRRITNSQLFEASPVLAADRKTVFFSREENGFRHVWVINANGKGERQLTFGRHLDRPVKSSKSGQFLLFYRSHVSFLGSGHVALPMLLDLHDPASSPHSVGKLAVMSTNSDRIVFLDSDDALRSFVLSSTSWDGVPLESRGMPVDLSPDGRFLLTTLPARSGAAWHQRVIWLWDLQTGSGECIAEGYSGVLLGTPASVAVITKALKHDIYAYDIVGKSLTQLNLRGNIRTQVKVTNDGLGVLMAEFEGSGRPGFSILSLTGAVMRVNNVASVSCSRQ